MAATHIAPVHEFELLALTGLLRNYLSKGVKDKLSPVIKEKISADEWRNFHALMITYSRVKELRAGKVVQEAHSMIGIDMLGCLREMSCGSFEVYYHYSEAEAQLLLRIYKDRETDKRNQLDCDAIKIRVANASKKEKKLNKELERERDMNSTISTGLVGLT